MAFPCTLNTENRKYFYLWGFMFVRFLVLLPSLCPIVFKTNGNMKRGSTLDSYSEIKKKKKEGGWENRNCVLSTGLWSVCLSEQEWSLLNMRSIGYLAHHCPRSPRKGLQRLETRAWNFSSLSEGYGVWYSRTWSPHLPNSEQALGHHSFLQGHL